MRNEDMKKEECNCEAMTGSKDWHTYDCVFRENAINQNNIRSVEDIVWEFKREFSISDFEELNRSDYSLFQDWLRTKIIDLLTHIKEEIGGTQYVSAVEDLHPEWNAAKSEDIALIDSFIHPIQ